MAFKKRKPIKKIQREAEDQQNQVKPQQQQEKQQQAKLEPEVGKRKKIERDTTQGLIDQRAERARDQTKDLVYTGEYDASLKEQRKQIQAQVDDEGPTSYDKAKERIEISQKIFQGEINPKEYRGQKGYARYLPETEDDLRKKKYQGTLGPVKAKNHVKVVTRIDYNPMMCKDYKLAGVCPFGDTCIFIHDRADYKLGWQIDQELEEQERDKERKLKARLENGNQQESESDQDKYLIREEQEDDFPQICPICEDEFKQPVKTVCGHFFCLNCAMKQYSKSSKCFVCNEPTHGTFNSALQLIKNLKEKRLKDLIKQKEDEGKTDLEKQLEEVAKLEQEKKRKIKAKNMQASSGWVIH